MDRHLDFTVETEGNASKLNFLWFAVSAQLNLLSDLTTQTNRATQQIKYDKPEFAMQFLRQQAKDWRSFRQQLNLWMQRNQKSRYNLDALHSAIGAFNNNEELTEEEIAEARRCFEQIVSRSSQRTAPGGEGNPEEAHGDVHARGGNA